MSGQSEGRDDPHSGRLIQREFVLYAAGQAVSAIGDRVALIALVFLVIHVWHGYAPALAAFYVMRVLPVVLGGMLAGLVADTFDRKTTLIACDVGRALLLALVPAVTTFNSLALYPMVFALFAFTVVFNTTARAMLPDVVPEERMIGANSTLRGIETSADAAYALGGVLIVSFSLYVPFFIDAATFLVSALTILLMRIPSRVSQTTEVAGALRSRALDGLAYLRDQPFLKWSTVSFALAPFAGGAVFVVTPLYASNVLYHSAGLVGPLHSGAFRFSLLEVSTGAGALVGSLIAPALAGHWPRGRMFATGVSGFGISIALLAAVNDLYVACIVFALTGLFNSLFVIAGMTAIQTLTPSALRGRVVAARLTIINGSLAVGSVAGGLLLTHLSLTSVWLVLGAAILVASAFVWIPRAARQQV